VLDKLQTSTENIREIAGIRWTFNSWGGKLKKSIDAHLFGFSLYTCGYNFASILFAIPSFYSRGKRLSNANDKFS
jgi:hypothetical protein